MLLGSHKLLLSLQQVQRTHALTLVSGALHHFKLSYPALILAHAALFRNSLFSTSHLLNRHPAFLWNSLIRAYSLADSHCDAFTIYNQMLHVGTITPDRHTFSFVLWTCATLSALEKGMEIHATVFKLGFHADVFVSNNLISLYSSVHLPDACRVFNEMPARDIVSWNSIMAAFFLNDNPSRVLDCFFELKVTTSLKPNSVTVISALPSCAKLQDEESTREIHGYVVKVGLDSHLTVCTALVDAYAKCGNCEGSKLVFDRMVDKTVVSWNAIITGFAHAGHLPDALLMFRSMVVAEVTPDSITLSSVLSMLVEMKYFLLGREIHAFSIRRGFASIAYVANCLIDLYSKSGRSRESSFVFDLMDTRSIVAWNSLIANFAMNGLEFEAIRLLSAMQVDSECPDSITFTNVLPAIARMGFLRQGKEIHAMSIRKGFYFNLFVSNALIDMYAKCHCLTLARNVFDTLPKDEVSYNVLIMRYSYQTELCLESLNLFLQMRHSGVKHDAVSLMGVLSACANLAMMKQGKEIHGQLMRAYQSHLFVLNSLLALYAKCGRLDIARKIFNRMPERDVATWNTMIYGYGMQGDLEAAIGLFEAMTLEGIVYDSVSYLAVLSACSHGGWVERGVKYFNEMISRGIRPINTHHACLVDLLGRAGLMEEAAELIRQLPIEADENVWGALLGACKVNGNAKLGRWASEHLSELKPEHCGSYVLLSNIYAEAGNWEEASRVRESMESRGVRKEPGYSRLESSDTIISTMHKNDWTIVL
ncbi:hypothetical protein Sjap_005992 [Stephania japonica]|uniref:Pentatricopeptide repeat-containing protein n=1 Tax=Stephania japonica TaxID=461633 RepID=A0AAP0K6R1_9MAGN